MKATVYVAGAENDASFTAEQAETLDKALTAADVAAHDRVLSGRARFRGAGQPAVRRGGRRAALDRAAAAVRVRVAHLRRCH